MTFTDKFLWLIVHNCLSPTKADKVVILNRAVLMAAMIARFEVDFSCLLEVVMPERAFKVTNTYPFTCLIFSLCRSAGVSICHIDQRKTPLGTVDIGIIRDEANELAPRKGPRLKFPPLSENLAYTLALPLAPFPQPLSPLWF